MVRTFAEREVEPQAAEHDRREAFNRPLLGALGDLGLLGIAVPERFGGAGMDASAVGLDFDTPRHPLDADGVKLYCSTIAKRVADRAIQVLGANGYVGEYVVERLWRDARLLEIGGGTLEAHQRNITRNLLRHDRIL